MAEKTRTEKLIEQLHNHVYACTKGFADNKHKDCWQIDWDGVAADARAALEDLVDLVRERGSGYTGSDLIRAKAAKAINNIILLSGRPYL